MPNSFRGLFFFLIHVHFFLQPTHTLHHKTVQNYQPTATPTPSLTLIVDPTASITPTESPTPTPTETPTSTPNPTLEPSSTPFPTMTQTPTPTVTVTPIPTATPTPTETVSIIGNDISYPQCGSTFPSGQEFGIVGINGGISTTTNPCLSSELTWANISNSIPNQQKIQFYVNTANPGGLNTASWPKNNTDPSGTATTNPYGTCDGSDSLACAWQYGWNRANEDVISRLVPAAKTAGISEDPASYPWWLDVETVNTWKSGSDAALQSNVADLEGMVAYFQSKGATVGIYSSSLQWGEIVNKTSQGSNLNGLKSWLPGASDLAGAITNCTLPPLTTDGKVTLTQYTPSNFDFDYSCN